MDFFKMDLLNLGDRRFFLSFFKYNFVSYLATSIAADI